MKLVMTLLVRDEEDILRENIEFHLAHGVDFILATDNLSEDSTQEILFDYQQQGVLKYIFESEDNYLQTKWVTRMARMAKTDYEADWVINCDADEFWYPESHKSLKHILEDIPNEVHGLSVERYNFLPLIPERRPFYLSMIFREVQSLNHLGKPLPPKTCHRGFEDIIVRQGNHIIRFESGRKPVVLETKAISILHFPIRSQNQMTNKIIKGGRAYERSNLNPRIGAAWRELYQTYKDEGLESYFQENLYTQNELTALLSSGQVIQDTRLRDELKRLL